MDILITILGFIMNSWVTRLGEWIFAAGVAYWARVKNQQTAVAVATGLVTISALLWLHSQAALWVYEQQLSLKPRTTEEIVRKWLDDGHYGVQKITPNSETSFFYKVQTSSGVNLGVFQAKNEPNILVIQSDFGYPILASKLNEKRMRMFQLNLQREMLQRGMAYRHSTDKNVIIVELSFHINERMDAMDFADKLEYVDASVGLAHILANIELSNLPEGKQL